MLVTAALGEENSFQTRDPLQNPVMGQRIDAAPKDAAKDSFFGATDEVFPQIVSGGGWETVIVIVNMGSSAVDYTLQFFDETGNPMRITFRNYPALQIENTTAIIGRMVPGGSFNFSLFDATLNTQVGWALLTYNTTQSRIGGYALLRQKVAGRPDSEALVPLSAYDDARFFMPVDNLEGFTTAIAIANPASNLPNTVKCTFLGLDGVILGTDSFTIVPGGHVAFAIAQRFPLLRGRLATMLVESSLNRLSAMGLRFNSTLSFSSIPIMNWSGLR